MIRRALAALLPLFVVSSLHAGSQAGKLCISGAACDAAPAGARAIPAAAEPRTFTWIDANGASVILGVIPAGADELTMDATGGARLRLSSAEPARWPAATKLTVRQESQDWQVALTAAQAKAGIALRAAPGAYELSVTSDRHRPVTRPLTIATAPVDVMITLAPLPQLVGRVIGKATREPVPGAMISLPASNVVAVADGSGRFAFDVDPNHWPDTLTVGAGGFGTITLPVPRARASADLLDIELSTGATIRVTIDRDPTVEEVTVELYERRYDVRDATPIATKTVERETNAVTFEHVQEGTYALIARGAEPGQRRGVKFSVRSGEDRELSMSLHPVRLSMTTLLGGTPVSGAQVRLSSLDGLWREELRTNAAGTLDLTLWQLGKLSAVVSAETLTVPYREERTFTDTTEAEWTIHVSTREVRGRVVNASTGEPVANANVALEVKGGYSALTRADQDGGFVFTSAVPGEHAVSAAADGYQHDTLRYTFLESEQTHPVTIRLAPAASTRVIVRDAAGRPVAGAALLDFAGLTLMGERFTDDRGEVVVPLRAGETRDIYVIPRDGSFAVGKISMKPSTVTIPAGPATIVITARSTTNEPIPGVWVVLRYDGIPLPFEVQQTLARQQGAITVSGADGRIVLRQMPLGTYEAWPVGSAGEARALMSGLGDDAPVRIAARPGVNEALLQFAPRE